MLKRTIPLALALLMAAGTAAAQQDQNVTVGEALAFLITTQAVDTGDAARDRAAAQATSQTMSRALLSALATLPLTSSSGAFTYRFNPSLGTVERASESFGPFFVERAATSGRGQASLGVNWQYARFTRLSDMELREGTLVTTANQFTDEVEPFDVETLTLRIQSSIVTFAGSYGVTDRLDLSAAIPVVTLSLAGERTDTYRGTRFQQATANATATGLGDVLVRGKVNVARGSWGGFSVGGDLRLPTGSEENLVGAGTTGTRGFAVLSAGAGNVTGQLVGGISRGGIAEGLDVGGAISANPTPTLTLAAELFSRRLNEVGRVRQAVVPHPQIAGVQTLRLVQEEGSLTETHAAFGFKWNASTTWLVKATVLLPVNRAGLTAPLLPSVSLEYSF
ncbi:MAG TPA: hypothetical protein VK911_01535 [Vicinamibacterales bacterium]|nr:hypothetical protein [Vicinamibacterales bacterium]